MIACADLSPDDRVHQEVRVIRRYAGQLKVGIWDRIKSAYIAQYTLNAGETVVLGVSWNGIVVASAPPQQKPSSAEVAAALDVLKRAHE